MDYNPEVEIDFLPSKKMGLDYKGCIVTGVRGHAAKLGVQIGWEIIAINGEYIPSNTKKIDVTIKKIRYKKKVVRITFHCPNKTREVHFEDSSSQSNDNRTSLEIEDSRRKSKKKKKKKKKKRRKHHKHKHNDYSSFEENSEYSSSDEEDAFKSKSVFETYQIRKHRPYFTFLVIAICVAVFVLEIKNNGWKFEPFSVNMLYGPSLETLWSMGAKDTEAIIQKGEWSRIFIPMWLHGGLIHLLFNMFGFYKTSNDLERTFGTLSTALVYLISGVFSIIISAMFMPTDLTVGASGAIFGLFGACWADFIQNFSAIKNKWSYGLSMAFSTVLNLGFGMLPYLDNFCHLGGFVCGFIAGMIVYIQHKYIGGEKQSYKTYQVTLQLIFAGVLAILFFGALMILFLGIDPNGWCKYCSYISCIETPWWDCNVNRQADCSYYLFPNGTQEIQCPNGDIYREDSGNIEDNCRRLCS